MGSQYLGNKQEMSVITGIKRLMSRMADAVLDASCLAQYFVRNHRHYLINDQDCRHEAR